MESLKDRLKRLILGRTFSDEQLKTEKLSLLWGLPIMASDAISSVAYAVEEILMALVPALGLLAANYVGLVSIPIILLLVMLVFSYSQIINHYPNGGGSYVVSKENFGRMTSLLAAACLMVDYIMTVAVSISSATEAFVAALPALYGYRVLIAILCIAFVTIINLRGVSESSKIFGTPTYAFMISMAVLIVTGFVRMFFFHLGPITYTAAQMAQIQAQASTNALSGITIILFLRAFSSGCSALTGVEAVSDAVPNFKDPSQRTAKRVLLALGGTIVFIFGGTCFLLTQMHVVTLDKTTPIAQVSAAVFGSHNFMFFAVQFTTSLILLLAANTAYNGLPVLLSILAKDQYVPHQFSQRGTKLSFSNGIMFIFIIAVILLIAAEADSHKLIPFYAVGVFISFTVSQAGMFSKWIKTKAPGWHYKSLINGLGALVTGVGTVVVFTMKFEYGAWVLLIVIPLIIFFMHRTHRHYEEFAKSISAEGYDYHYTESKSRDKLPCVILVHSINKAMLKTLDYAKDISSDVTALHISTSDDATEDLKQQWADLGITIPLEVVETAYRDIMPPLEKYITEREKKLGKGQNLTVVLTKFVGTGWRDMIYHNQTTFFIESHLGNHRNIATILVPYLYHESNAKHVAGQ
ncbi:MAG: APC family permease [Defluviitaleaceae bacterium]|nr:APC family permease [Defluviitaleaceae bacterium]